MTKVTTSDYHDDLRLSARQGRAVTWIARRRWGLRLMHRFAMRPMIGNQLDGFVNDEIHVPSTTTPGHRIRVRIYRPENTTGPLPVMLYCHGGGYQVGVPEQAHPFFEDLLRRRDVAIAAPAYRLSLAGHPFPSGLDDCVDTIRHLRAHAGELDLRDDRYVIAGHSGGGGLAAALTHRVVDADIIDVAFQMPVYPMLDHRMVTPSAELDGTAIWDRRTNALAWDNYLGHLDGDVPEYASPALREDLAGLPPTITWVGSVEPFRDETIRYVEQLEAAGVPTMFRLFDGGYHAFEVLAPEAPISLEAIEFQGAGFAEYYDRYITGE